MFVYTMSHKIVHIPFYHLYLFSVHFQPFKVFQNLQGDCHETIPDFGVSTAILNTRYFRSVVQVELWTFVGPS